MMTGLACATLLTGGSIYLATRPSAHPPANPSQNQKHLAETPKTTNQIPQAPKAAEQAVNELPETTPATGTQKNTAADLPTIDNTWQTFTSKSGKYSFQWPTKGKYAPTWEQSFSDTNPCACNYACNDGGENKTLNGISFCHQSAIENPVTGGDGPHTGQATFLDTYSTRHENTYIILTFKKINAYAIDEDTYHAHLEQILSTFTFNP